MQLPQEPVVQVLPVLLTTVVNDERRVAALASSLLPAGAVGLFPSTHLPLAWIVGDLHIGASEYPMLGHISKQIKL